MYDTLLRRKSKGSINKMLFRISANLSLTAFSRVLERFVYIPYEPLTTEMRTKILEKHKGSNEMLSKKIDIDLSKYGYF